MTPGITIIIPVYNRADLVGRTLQSIMDQTYRPLSVVLVDNNSTDNTPQVLAQWQQKFAEKGIDCAVLQEKTPGAAAARNRGLETVDTQWTMFFDSDDTMAPDHVDRAMRAAGENPDARIIGWDVNLYFCDGKSAVKPFADRRIVYNCIMHGTMATQRYMAHTDLFRQAGGWDESVMVWNDIELGIRLLRLIADDAPDRSLVYLHLNPTVNVYAQADSITGVSYSAKMAEREHAIDCIERNITPNNRRWVSLKRLTLAALCSREPGHNPDVVKALRHKALAAVAPAWRRALLKAAYSYIQHGGRGSARILYPLL